MRSLAAAASGSASILPSATHKKEFFQGPVLLALARSPGPYFIVAYLLDLEDYGVY